MEDGSGSPAVVAGYCWRGSGFGAENRLLACYRIQEIDDIARSCVLVGDFDRFIIRRVRYMILKRPWSVTLDPTPGDRVSPAFHRFDCILED